MWFRATPTRKSKIKSLRNRSKLFFFVSFLIAWAFAAASGPGFRSREYLLEHFAKHGEEFGHISAEQYLSLAQQLRDVPAGRDILRSERPGGYAKYDRRTNSFGAFDNSGIIRTFFKPNDGERYFIRQSRIRNRND